MLSPPLALPLLSLRPNVDLDLLPCLVGSLTSYTKSTRNSSQAFTRTLSQSQVQKARYSIAILRSGKRVFTHRPVPVHRLAHFLICACYAWVTRCCAFCHGPFAHAYATKLNCLRPSKVRAAFGIVDSLSTSTHLVIEALPHQASSCAVLLGEQNWSSDFTAISGSHSCIHDSLTYGPWLLLQQCQNRVVDEGKWYFRMSTC